MFFKLLLALAAGYLLGSVSFSIIISKIRGDDIKKKGSGNAGLTNVLRVFGPKAAAFVLAGDVLKAVAACLLGYLLTAGEFGSHSVFDAANPNIGIMLAGTSCVVGHIFPVYFQFKGGKGVLTTATVVFMIDWRIGLALLCLFIIIVLITRIVSISSIIAAACFPVACIIMEKPAYCLVYAIAIAALIIIMHRQNIGRLLKGAEPKLKIGN